MWFVNCVSVLSCSKKKIYFFDFFFIVIIIIVFDYRGIINWLFGVFVFVFEIGLGSVSFGNCSGVCSIVGSYICDLFVVLC